MSMAVDVAAPQMPLPRVKMATAATVGHFRPKTTANCP
jgi:hypothetical protein